MQTLFLNWKRVLIEGIVLVLLGLLAISYPLVSSWSFAIFMGVILTIAGTSALTRAWNVATAQRDWIALLSGWLVVVHGLLMIVNPTFGVFTLTGLITALFALEGILRLALVAQAPPQFRSGWLLFSGFFALALAILVWSEWPTVALWFLGLLVGIHFIFSGMALILLSTEIKKSSMD